MNIINFEPLNVEDAFISTLMISSGLVRRKLIVMGRRRV